MEENKSILHELYVFCEWKPEPEYIQKTDSILPENISALLRWIKFFGPKKSLIDSITAHKERQQKWHIALGDEGKVMAVLTDNILEIRTKRSEYATIAARTTVSRDAYSQWRKLVWSPDCSFLVLAYGNGVVSFLDLTASNLFNIPIDCSRPGGLECTDNTHAVADIIFMPLRVKDNKWNWEVVIVTYDGKVRGFVVSQTDGCKLHHTFRFPGGVSAVAYCPQHTMLLVAGLPRGADKDPSSPLSAGITAWRILSDDPFYKLSVVSDHLEGQLANKPFQFYIPFVTAKNLAFIIQMALSPDGSRLVCLHCNGDISTWRLPLLSPLARLPLPAQPQHELRSPLAAPVAPPKYHAPDFYGADVSWWTEEAFILSRYSGAVSVCNISDMVNILGKKPEFFQGVPRVTCAHDGTFMVLECESNTLPVKKSGSDESMEVVKQEEVETSLLGTCRELAKWALYRLTDMEAFQPRPRPITVLSRVYRLLAVRSTTPKDLFARKIESGNYTEALALAERFQLDCDLVFQQQWRKKPVSSEAIENYLSKVTKKIWAVHQCVDRLPETLPAAQQLLQFGLQITNEKILNEINKDRENPLADHNEIKQEHLNAFTSELLRCRHVMLFYKERLRLYEAILRCEKSTYAKDEYDRLRSNSIVHSAMEIAKEGRIEALTCLWPYIRSIAMQLVVLDKLPETINPLDYQHLLPTKEPIQWFEKKSPIKIKPSENEHDWCRKDIFRSIWSSNWSEETSPESESVSSIVPAGEDYAEWYIKRAHEIEELSGLASHALTLVTIAMVGGAVPGLEKLMFHLLTLDTLIYDINVEDVTLADVEKMTVLETCTMLMKMSTPATFVSDLKQFVVPFLKRLEHLGGGPDACLSGLADFLESISQTDLGPILLVLQSPNEFELDVRTHLELAERCLFAHTGTDQLDKAVDLLDAMLKESDGSISCSSLVRRVRSLEKLVAASGRLAARGVAQPPQELRLIAQDPARAQVTLTGLARSRNKDDEKPTPQDWADLLKDILDLQSSLFTCVTKEQCYEIYAMSLLTSGSSASIRLAADALSLGDSRRAAPLVPLARAVQLVLQAAKEYFNSASSLDDPALDLAKCCLTLIKESNPNIEEELDLIAALQLLNAFEMSILPIQVRLCENRITLIEECLNMDPNAYLASHKLLKLAKLLRVCGDDEQAREGAVLQLVCSRALSAGPGGFGAARAAAARLAALRHAPAAELLALVAERRPSDRAASRQLLAAAAAHVPPSALEETLRSRLELELEGLKQMGSAMREHDRLARAPSGDLEFADAITTPVIEKKDLVAPDQPEKKPLLNYLLNTIQDKFNLGEKAEVNKEPIDCSVHVPEFYRSLYPEHKASPTNYGYDRFSIPDADSPGAVGQSVLKWFYIQNCLDDDESTELEPEVVQKCAEEILYKDTPLSVSCLLRLAREDEQCSPGHESYSPEHSQCSREHSQCSRVLATQHSAAAASAALYATLVSCHAQELRDNVYLTRPVAMARTALKQKTASEEHLSVIRACVEKLSGVGEVARLRQLGYSVNGLLFNADEDYRLEVINRVARSSNEDHVIAAQTLGYRYGLDALELWLQHASADPSLSKLALSALPMNHPNGHARIKEVLWPLIPGNAHNALLALFALLRRLDERPLILGLTAADHVKLLKKARAASHDLDYKLLVEQPSPEQFKAHMLSIMKPENVGMLGKFLRTLPPAVKLPFSVTALYTMWLIKYFFSVPAAAASSKKWMQQWRQCASYFNKLSEGDLLRFVSETCFSEEAIDRVPFGTRSLMIMQAVDYCQQEHENEFKYNKQEQSWSQVGQELTRWARFLDNFYSSTVGSIRDKAEAELALWLEVEKSHGSPELLLPAVSELVLHSQLRPAGLASMLQCLHSPLDADHIFRYAHHHYGDVPEKAELLLSRLLAYHKEGVQLSPELVEQACRGVAPPPTPTPTPTPASALASAAAKVSSRTLREHWPDAHAHQDEELMSEEGRRAAFAEYLELSDTWRRKKALADVVNCWPHTYTRDGKSLHYEYLLSLTRTGDQKENLQLIKLLLQRPVLSDEELKALTADVKNEAVVNAIWICLLSKCESSHQVLSNFLLQHKETIIKQEIDDALIKEILDDGLFLKLVSTPIFSALISYIITKDSSSTEPNHYTVVWATNELFKANHLAEAGHLYLMANGVPSALRGFSQTVIYCKNMFKK